MCVLAREVLSPLGAHGSYGHIKLIFPFDISYLSVYAEAVATRRDGHYSVPQYISRGGV
jgi:hypothetical protein